MGMLSSQVKSELRLLPYILAKLLGGAMAVFGFAAMVITVTRRDGNSFADTLPSGTACLLGIIIFLFSSRILNRRRYPIQSDGENRIRSSLLPWMILLALATAFLICTYFITR